MDAADLVRLLELRDASRRIPYCPHEPLPQQRKFLELTGREALYGGAAGGGKSDALLMAALQYIHVGGYNALLLRRTFQDLNKPEALMHRAREWFSPYMSQGVTWNERDKRWSFPTPDGGVATLGFGYCDHINDVEQYQGAAYQYVAFDEVTHFVEQQYTYLFSRQRRAAGVDIPLRMRAATNPGGVGHAWVMARFGLNEDGSQKAEWVEKRPNGDRRITRDMRLFIPAKMEDNWHLDQAGYTEQLNELDATRHDQLRHGLWIQDAKLRIFHYDQKRSNVPALPRLASDPRGQMWRRVFVIDLGASTQDRTTSFTRLAFHPHIPDAVFVEFSRRTAGEDPWTIEDACTKQVEECGEDLTIVMDEGALGKGYGNGIRSRHAIPLIPAEKGDKRGYTRLLRGAIERGHIHCVEGQCGDLVSEMESLVYDKHGMDAEPGLANHCCDGLLYGWRWTYAHRSQAPSDRPAVGSDDWFRAEEQRRIDAEYEAARLRREEDPWTHPNPLDS